MYYVLFFFLFTLEYKIQFFMYYLLVAYVFALVCNLQWQLIFFLILFLINSSFSLQLILLNGLQGGVWCFTEII